MSIFENVIISKAVDHSDFDSYINMNTLFIVVVVLAVLLLIALAYLANIMSYLKNNTSVKNTDQNNSVNASAIQSTSNDQGNLVSDTELVAVITAAIYASMGDSAPADGFVVRSIRKAR